MKGGGVRPIGINDSVCKVCSVVLLHIRRVHIRRELRVESNRRQRRGAEVGRCCRHRRREGTISQRTTRCDAQAAELDVRKVS